MKPLARLAITAAAVAIAGCAAILGIDDGIPRDGGTFGDASDASTSDVVTDAQTDVATDAGDGAVPMCDVDASFAAPTAFSKLDSAGNDAHLRLVAATELVGYFQSIRDGGLGGTDIYTATRTSIGDTWAAATAVTTVNSASNDTDPSISADQLTLYMARANKLMRATRTSTSTAFGAPVALTAINSALADFGPYLVDDGTALYFSSTRNSDAGVSELFVTTPEADGGFGAVANVNGTGLKTGDNRFAAVTADQLVLYFASNRTGTGTQGGYDIWVATRTSTSVAFGTPRVVMEVNSASNEWPDWVSSDRCRLYFTSDQGTTGQNLYVATKTPP